VNKQSDYSTQMQWTGQERKIKNAILEVFFSEIDTSILNGIE
jgi:hypothetical protein